jgi:hypothetical protein
MDAWDKLLTKIKQLDSSPVTPESIKAFQKGEWNHPIFKIPQWSLLAFVAYLNGLLEERYVPKLLLFHACQQETCRDCEVSTFQIFDNLGNLHEDSLKTFQKGLKGYFTAQCISKIVERLRQLPPESSQFFEIQQEKK